MTLCLSSMYVAQRTANMLSGAIAKLNMLEVSSSFSLNVTKQAANNLINLLAKPDDLFYKIQGKCNTIKSFLLSDPPNNSPSFSRHAQEVIKETKFHGVIAKILFSVTFSTHRARKKDFQPVYQH